MYFLVDPKHPLYSNAKWFLLCCILTLNAVYQHILQLQFQKKSQFLDYSQKWTFFKSLNVVFFSQ